MLDKIDQAASARHLVAEPEGQTSTLATATDLIREQVRFRPCSLGSPVRQKTYRAHHINSLISSPAIASTDPSANHWTGEIRLLSTAGAAAEITTRQPDGNVLLTHAHAHEAPDFLKMVALSSHLTEERSPDTYLTTGSRT